MKKETKTELSEVSHQEIYNKLNDLFQKNGNTLFNYPCIYLQDEQKNIDIKFYLQSFELFTTIINYHKDKFYNDDIQDYVLTNKSLEILNDSVDTLATSNQSGGEFLKQMLEHSDTYPFIK